MYTHGIIFPTFPTMTTPHRGMPNHQTTPHKGEPNQETALQKPALP